MRKTEPANICYAGMIPYSNILIIIIAMTDLSINTADTVFCIENKIMFGKRS